MDTLAIKNALRALSFEGFADKQVCRNCVVYRLTLKKDNLIIVCDNDDFRPVCSIVVRSCDFPQIIVRPDTIHLSVTQTGNWHYDVTIQTKSSTITLRISPDDAYVIRATKKTKRREQ